MSRQLIDGVWVIVCDWEDGKGKKCDLGLDGEPTMFVDPEGNNGTGEKHYQCGRHHGFVPQSEKPEFQLPKDHKLNESVMRPGKEMSGPEVEEVPENV